MHINIYTYRQTASATKLLLYEFTLRRFVDPLEIVELKPLEKRSE